MNTNYIYLNLKLKKTNIIIEKGDKITVHCPTWSDVWHSMVVFIANFFSNL